MKTKCWLLLSFIVIFNVTCTKDDGSEESSGITTGNKMLALDISTTTDADALYICYDGSYAIYDAENKQGLGTIQINSSYENDFWDGITIILNEEKHPMIAMIGDNYVIFDNFTNNSFDCAVIDNTGNISYHWNLKIDNTLSNMYEYDLPQNIKTRSDLPDEKKAKMAFGLKVLGFTAIAIATVASVSAVIGTAPILAVIGGGVAIVSLANTIYSEGEKSGLWENNYISYAEYPTQIMDKAFSFLDNKTGEIKFNVAGVWQFGISVVADLSINLGDLGLNSVGYIKEITVDPVLSNKEWQIILSTSSLNCTPEEKTYKIDVANNMFTTSGSLSEYKKYLKIECDENNRLIMNLSRTILDEEVTIISSMKFIFERIETTKATGKMSGHNKYTYQSESEMIESSGKFTGNLITNNQ